MNLAMTTAIVTSLFVAVQAQASSPEVIVHSVTAAGSLCPAGTVADHARIQGNLLEITADGWMVEAGPGIPATSARRNCQLAFSLGVPLGWSVGVVGTEQEVDVSLDSGMNAEVQTRVYFQGSMASASSRATFRGPMNDTGSFADIITRPVWSSCGGANRSMIVNVSYTLTPRGHGTMVVREPVRLKLGLQRCP